jgi:cytochrome d ubiquinol oxidase subunit I
VPRSEWPPVAIVFWSFRIMVAIGVLMLGLGLWSLWARWRGGLYQRPLLLRAAVAMGPAGFVAVIAGWITTEVGRQPYVIQGLLRTADAVSPLAAPAVASSLVAFVIVYFIVFGAGFFYILRLLRRGVPGMEEEAPGLPQRAAGITPAPAMGRRRGG